MDRYLGHGPVTGCTLTTRNSGIGGGGSALATVASSATGCSAAVDGTNTPVICTRRPIHGVTFKPLRRYPSTPEAELSSAAVLETCDVAAVSPAVPTGVDGVLDVPLVPMPILAEPISIVPRLEAAPGIPVVDTAGVTGGAAGVPSGIGRANASPATDSAATAAGPYGRTIASESTIGSDPARPETHPVIVTVAVD